MKTLMMSLMAAAFVLAAASFASAGVMGSSYHGLTAIDSAGLASIAIQSPAAPVEFASTADKVFLDSNHLWSANDIHVVPYGGTAVAEKGMMNKGVNLLCFDSVSKFCAKAY